MVSLRGAEADAIRIEFQIDDLRQRQSRRHQEAEIVLTERERERTEPIEETLRLSAQGRMD